MQFHILTLFPEMVENGLQTSILGRAIQKGLIGIHAVNIRDYSKDKHHHVDDAPYGGGAGMVMQPEPIYDAYEDLAARTGKRPRVIYLTPQGQVFNQKIAEELAKEEDLVFLCGHYEGIDERVYTLADHVISLGDYVLTSGELASMVVIDAAVRKLPGVLGAAEGPVDESFTSGLLEYPQYTRPADFRGMRVPEVLTSGNHAAIARWRREQSLARTAAARPDLIAAAEAAGRLTPADQKFLKLLEPAPTGAAEGVS